MATTTIRQDSLNQSGRNLLRVLIASYFVAVSTGLISGTDATPLAATFLAAEPAALIGASALFILGLLVLTGIWLRPAAMLLGIITFCSSFILHFGPAGTAPLGDFWRDLILVGALMLTYSRSSSRRQRRGAMIRWPTRPRRLDANSKIAPRRVKLTDATNLCASTQRTTVYRPVDNIFLDDLNDAKAS